MARLTAELLAVLRCPVTRTPLVQDGDELVSTGTGPDGVLRYRLEEDIPVLLPQEQTTSAAGNGATPTT